jgi:hypothetical protein
VYGLVSGVDEYSNLHGQLNNFQSADSTSRQNHVAVTYLSRKERLQNKWQSILLETQAQAQLD